jgi:hypothetical protein
MELPPKNRIQYEYNSGLKKKQAEAKDIDVDRANFYNRFRITYRKRA